MTGSGQFGSDRASADGELPTRRLLSSVLPALDMSEVFDAAPVPAAIVLLGPPATEFLAANASFTRRYGTGGPDGLLLADVLPIEALEVALRRDGTASLRTKYVGADGTVEPVTARATLLAQHGERPLAMVQLERTQPTTGSVERALRESERRLEAMADNVNALIYLKHADGQYLLVNRCFESEFAVVRDEVNGKRDVDILPPDIAAAYGYNDRLVLATGRPMQFEEPRPGGGVYLSLKFPLRGEDGRPYAVGGISTDITDRNLAQIAVREAKEEAERANLAKSEFLSRMSHELRTPLNSILGFGQLLSLKAPPDVREPAAHIVDAGRHLLALINEVLEITRIEQGGTPVVCEEVAAATPLLEALDLVAPLAAARGLELVRDLHEGLFTMVIADRQRLKQALLNLLSNAVKYNRDDGIVTASFSRPGPDRLRYRIADTGIGMDPEDVERAFLPFHRLEGDASAVEGTGLGLTLSKSVIEAMGGEIGVEATKKGRGSVFYIDLPARHAAAPTPNGDENLPARSAPATEQCATTTSVLYIEDNQSNVTLMESILADAENVQLMVAPTGRRGLRLARQHRPDLILLDLQLPGLGGEDVLAELRQSPQTADIPIVILSADATPKQIERLREAGANDYITKPLEVTMLLETIQRLSL